MAEKTVIGGSSVTAGQLKDPFRQIDDGSGNHIIDCDAIPHIPSGLVGIEYHKKGGQLSWNPSNFKLWLHPEQKNGVRGHELREWAQDKPMHNACVLDYLLGHPEVIPPECKGKWTYFWDTIYHDSRDRLYVRCLGRLGERPVSRYDWLGDGWFSNGPAAGSAS